mgnify:CR=1 FL=1
MKITIKAKSLVLTPLDTKDMDRHIAKIKTLVKKYGEAVTLDIEVSKPTNHHRKGMIYMAKATLVLQKKMMRSESEGESVIGAFEGCRKDLEREIEKHKTGKEEKNYRDARKLKKMSRMTPLAWRGPGREEEQKEETETALEDMDVV